jgi:hypothetical protein
VTTFGSSTLLLLLISATVGAQGVATAGIHGTASADHGRIVDARVRVTQEATGFAVEVTTSGGQFLVEGLEPGGPYTITARSIGLVPQRAMTVRYNVISSLTDFLDGVYIRWTGP